MLLEQIRWFKSVRSQVEFRTSASRGLCHDRRSVGQSVLVSSTHLGLTTRSLLLSDCCRFVDMGRSLSQLLLTLASLNPVGLAPCFTVSDSRIPFSSPPTTRRATVGVFEPASTRDSESELLYNWRVTPISSSWRRAPWDSRPQCSFQLNTCGHSPFVTSSLTTGWVCRLQLLLVLASAVILRSESRRTRDHILLSQIRDSPNLEPRSPSL
jgi:hypothetical protein